MRFLGCVGGPDRGLRADLPGVGGAFRFTCAVLSSGSGPLARDAGFLRFSYGTPREERCDERHPERRPCGGVTPIDPFDAHPRQPTREPLAPPRSAERRVGKEGT